MASFLEQVGREVAKTYIHQRLAIPAADKAAVAAATAQYTEDGAPLTVDQVDASDKAIIDYVEGKIEGTLTHKE